MKKSEELQHERIVIANYNLHGIQDNDASRFPEIAAELAFHNVDICGLQEVICGSGIEDTSYQIARHASSYDGATFSTYWAYCHKFYDRYPEGISILSRYPIENPQIISLDVTLKKGAKPLMPRYALAAEIGVRGHRVLFTTLHLDHHPLPTVRTAQAAVLVNALKKQFTLKEFRAIIITGDFNARESSMCLRFFKRQGFKDTYRSLFKTGGNTFPSSEPVERIDYILLKGESTVENSFLVMHNPSLSDHLGIITVLTPQAPRKRVVRRTGAARRIQARKKSGA
ncbi:MAG: endonuclease/exonuclease/phosphatase family protein [Candidatus Xenobiia bacterium LiM19]